MDAPPQEHSLSASSTAGRHSSSQNSAFPVPSIRVTASPLHQVSLHLCESARTHARTLRAGPQLAPDTPGLQNPSYFSNAEAAQAAACGLLSIAVRACPANSAKASGELEARSARTF